MANLVKPWIVTYRSPSGRKCRKGDAGSTATRSRAAKWYGQGIPGLPSEKRVPLCTGKAAAQRMLDDLVRRAEQGLAGLPVDHVQPLEPLIALWEVAMARKGGAKHVKEAARQARLVFATAKIATLADLRTRGVVDLVESAIHAIQTKNDFTGRTAAKHGKAAKSFSRWLWRKKQLLESDPLAGVALPNQDAEAPRRDMTPAELATLLDTAAASLTKLRRLRGPDRAMVYLTAAATGLRVLELSRLTPGNFDLGGDEPRVVLAGVATKNRKLADQPLPPAVANRLSAYLADRPAKGRIWPGRWWEKAAEILRADLSAAGIEPVNARGELVFHSLRHTYVSMLATVAPAAVVQGLARHEDSSTTELYTHTQDSQRRTAVEAMPLPGMLPSSPLSGLSRADLEALTLGLLAAARIWFAPGLARTPLDSEADRDAGRRKAQIPGPTKTNGKSRKPPTQKVG